MLASDAETPAEARRRESVGRYEAPQGNIACAGGMNEEEDIANSELFGACRRECYREGRQRAWI